MQGAVLYGSPEDLLCSYLPPWGGGGNVCEILMVESKKPLRETQTQSLKLPNAAGQGPKLRTHESCCEYLPSVCLVLST